MLNELFRVCKSGGSSIVMQGIASNVEHINIMTEEQLITDFINAGFVLNKFLPARHYLFKKP